MATPSPPCLRNLPATLVLAWALSNPFLAVPGQDRGGPPGSDKTEQKAEAQELRKTRSAEMRRRAESTLVARLGGAKEPRAELVAEPVLRYSGEFHGVIDATVWVYGRKGRPLAVEKIELLRTPYLKGYYYCLASLCQDRIEVRWPRDPAWSSTKPGIETRVLPDGPKPASSETARTRQMREVIRRFAATRIDRGEGREIREENRLLAQPIHRYCDPDSGLQDGAVFALIASGTNPDFLLLLELRGADLAHATWHYAAARMTTGELHLRLDGKDVWSVPWEWLPGQRNAYPTYVHFLSRE